MSVHMVMLVKAVDFVVLLDATNDEPSLVRVEEEEGFAVDGVVQLASLSDVKEDVGDEDSRVDSVHNSVHLLEFSI